MSKRNWFVPADYIFSSVGVMPQGSIGGMTPNVWWIATGQTMSSLSTNSFSNREAQTGAVYFLDMTKQSYSKLTLSF